MRSSDSIVGILGKERQEMYVIDDEKFVSAKFTCCKEEFAVVGSEYILEEMEGKVRLDACIETIKINNEKKSVIYVLKVIPIKEEEKDIEDSMEFQIGGVVAFKRDLKVVGGSCSQLLPFTISYSSSDGRKHYLNCVVYNKDARKLQSLRVGQVVSGRGYLKYHKENLEFVLTKEISCRDRIQRREEVV
jgi:hypothetical protein